jgi:hypothetical protein
MDRSIAGLDLSGESKTMPMNHLPKCFWIKYNWAASDQVFVCDKINLGHALR